MKKSILKFHVFLILISILPPLFLNACAAHHQTNVVMKPQDFRLSENDKIALSSIHGWEEAVGIFKDALIDSLLPFYTHKEDEANYVITGKIFVEKRWNYQLYVYDNIDLRVLDKKGNVIVSIRNQEPVYQHQLSLFTDDVAKSLEGAQLEKN